MKRFLFVIFLSICAICSFAQEKASALRDVKISRHIDYVDVEGFIMTDVYVEIKSNDPDFVFVTKDKVTFTIYDTDGTVLYKRKMKGDALYLFNDGQVQIGRPNFTKILIKKYDEEWRCKIREKEGIY